MEKRGRVNMQTVAIEMFKDEILSLQKEIQALTQQYEENQQEVAFLSSTNIKKKLESYRGNAVTDVLSYEAKEKEKLQIGKYEKDLQFLSHISGIEFTKYLKKTECKSENKTLYKHRLVGQ
ncbi:centromere protein P-like, partial [Discoglossus pictus]